MNSWAVETRALTEPEPTQSVSPQVRNALSVDVEDYFQVRAFEKVVSRDSWHSFELRVERNTIRLLDLFEAARARATFFVLGWVAAKCPDLVREIQSRGHEIACHGHLHRSVQDLTPREFREDIRKAKAVLESLTNSPVIGFRAPSFSIVSNTLWALDALAKEGFQYDSSIFPIVHDHYGIPTAQRFPFPINADPNQPFFEFPISTVNVGRWNLPFSGGGYLRQLPFWFVRWATRHLSEKERQPVLLYVHPWEIDPEQPRIRAPLLARIRHYRNIHKTEERLVALLSDFEFTTVREVLGL